MFFLWDLSCVQHRNSERLWARLNEPPPALFTMQYSMPLRIRSQVFHATAENPKVIVLKKKSKQDENKRPKFEEKNWRSFRFSPGEIHITVPKHQLR